MLLHDVRDLVREHAGELALGCSSASMSPRRDEDVAARRGEGVDRRRLDDPEVPRQIGPPRVQREPAADVVDVVLLLRALRRAAPRRAARRRCRLPISTSSGSGMSRVASAAFCAAPTAAPTLTPPIENPPSTARREVLLLHRLAAVRRRARGRKQRRDDGERGHCERVAHRDREMDLRFERLHDARLELAGLRECLRLFPGGGVADQHRRTPAHSAIALVSISASSPRTPVVTLAPRLPAARLSVCAMPPRAAALGRRADRRRRRRMSKSLAQPVTLPDLSCTQAPSRLTRSTVVSAGTVSSDLASAAGVLLATRPACTVTAGSPPAERGDRQQRGGQDGNDGMAHASPQAEVRGAAADSGANTCTAAARPLTVTRPQSRNAKASPQAARVVASHQHPCAALGLAFDAACQVHRVSDRRVFELALASR